PWWKPTPDAAVALVILGAFWAALGLYAPMPSAPATGAQAAGATPASATPAATCLTLASEWPSPEREARIARCQEIERTAGATGASPGALVIVLTLLWISAPVWLPILIIGLVIWVVSDIVSGAVADGIRRARDDYRRW